MPPLVGSMWWLSERQPRDFTLFDSKSLSPPNHKRLNLASDDCRLRNIKLGRSKFVEGFADDRSLVSASICEDARDNVPHRSVSPHAEIPLGVPEQRYYEPFEGQSAMVLDVGPHGDAKNRRDLGIAAFGEPALPWQTLDAGDPHGVRYVQQASTDRAPRPPSTEPALERLSVAKCGTCGACSPTNLDNFDVDALALVDRAHSVCSGACCGVRNMDLDIVELASPGVAGTAMARSPRKMRAHNSKPKFECPVEGKPPLSHKEGAQRRSLGREEEAKGSAPRPKYAPEIRLSPSSALTDSRCVTSFSTWAPTDGVNSVQSMLSRRGEAREDERRQDLVTQEAVFDVAQRVKLRCNSKTPDVASLRPPSACQASTASELSFGPTESIHSMESRSMHGRNFAELQVIEDATGEIAHAFGVAPRTQESPRPRLTFLASEGRDTSLSYGPESVHSLYPRRSPTAGDVHDVVKDATTDLARILGLSSVTANVGGRSSPVSELAYSVAGSTIAGLALGEVEALISNVCVESCGSEVDPKVRGLFTSQWPIAREMKVQRSDEWQHRAQQEVQRSGTRFSMRTLENIDEGLLRFEVKNLDFDWTCMAECAQKSFQDLIKSTGLGGDEGMRVAIDLLLTTQARLQDSRCSSPCSIGGPAPRVVAPTCQDLQKKPPRRHRREVSQADSALERAAKMVPCATPSELGATSSIFGAGYAMAEASSPHSKGLAVSSPPLSARDSKRPTSAAREVTSTTLRPMDVPEVSAEPTFREPDTYLERSYRRESVARTIESGQSDATSLDVDCIVNGAVGNMFRELLKENKNLRRDHRRGLEEHARLCQEYERVMGVQSRGSSGSALEVAGSLASVPDVGQISKMGFSLDEENRHLLRANRELSQVNEHLNQAAADVESELSPCRTALTPHPPSSLPGSPVRKRRPTRECSTPPQGNENLLQPQQWQQSSQQQPQQSRMLDPPQPRVSRPSTPTDVTPCGGNSNGRNRALASAGAAVAERVCAEAIRTRMESALDSRAGSVTPSCARWQDEMEATAHAAASSRRSGVRAMSNASSGKPTSTTATTESPASSMPVQNAPRNDRPAQGIWNPVSGELVAQNSTPEDVAVQGRPHRQRQRGWSKTSGSAIGSLPTTRPTSLSGVGSTSRSVDATSSSMRSSGGAPLWSKPHSRAGERSATPGAVSSRSESSPRCGSTGATLRGTLLLGTGATMKEPAFRVRQVSNTPFGHGKAAVETTWNTAISVGC